MSILKKSVFSSLSSELITVSISPFYISTNRYVFCIKKTPESLYKYKHLTTQIHLTTYRPRAWIHWNFTESLQVFLRIYHSRPRKSYLHLNFTKSTIISYEIGKKIKYFIVFDQKLLKIV